MIIITGHLSDGVTNSDGVCASVEFRHQPKKLKNKTDLTVAKPTADVLGCKHRLAVRPYQLRCLLKVGCMRSLLGGTHTTATHHKLSPCAGSEHHPHCILLYWCRDMWMTKTGVV